MTWYKTLKNLRHFKLRNIRNYWVNDGPKLVIILLFILINIIVMGERFDHYLRRNPKPYHILGAGVLIARATAASIKFCSALILLTVLRNLISALRGTWLSTYVPFDKALVWHRYLAWIIAFMGTIHVCAHMINYHTIETWDIGRRRELFEALHISSQPNAWQSLWTTIAGITGMVVVIAMVLMYTSAISNMRRKYFETFWYTHHLFIIYLIGLSIHGAQALLEFPTFWAWIILPLIAYMIERSIRILRGSQETILEVAIQHPSKVIELQMGKSSFRFKSGQYLFLNCPYLSEHEWHPFTITSAPEDKFVSVHIRAVGDWTKKLTYLMNPNGGFGIVAQQVLTAQNGDALFRIDGPFGAASEDVFKYENVVLIAAGIGVTPFASVLKTIRYRIESGGVDNDEENGGSSSSGETSSLKKPCKIKKVHFYWVGREPNAFEWFFELLSSLEEENVNDFLDINLYLTIYKSKEEADQKKNKELEIDGRDAITGLRKEPRYGRPNFGEIFQSVADQHQNSKVGVFFCGPRVMSKQLYKYCKKFTKKTSTKFRYHKENF
eukprot:TRINITY_DN3946_c0_g1_i1.p1 TRINITY_DN3946_c0_g1~~TRINITY_DN3946_c0_g1_i1.p1  ORF type:complete len:553 (+),score=54.50 TRINITY_DN3946_c0_g1_i1:88-1746(+)